MAKPEIAYNPKNETLTVTDDINDDGVPDITLKVRVRAVIARYWPHIGTVGAIITALAAAHEVGLI